MVYGPEFINWSALSILLLKSDEFDFTSNESILKPTPGSIEFTKIKPIDTDKIVEIRYNIIVLPPIWTILKHQIKM